MSQINTLNQFILDSLPHWAMLIEADTRKVIALNKLAKDGGASINSQCWDDFGHRQFISEEHKNVISKNPDRKRDNQIKCDFCMADEALESTEPTRKEVEIEGVVWDTWWVPVEKNIYLHYAMDITDLKQAESVKIKAAQLESTLQTVAAVCHTITQPLQVLTSSLDIIDEDVSHELMVEAKSSVRLIGEITKKLRKIFKYQTKEHIDGSEILDIEASSE